MRKLKLDELGKISAYDYYKFYLKNSRVIGLTWLFLTICFTICLFIVFVSPEWIGDTLSSPNRGYFGMYEYCVRNFLMNSYHCTGTWTDFSTLPNTPALQAACFFIGFALLLSFICIAVAFLGVCIKYERIFHICAWIQLIIFISLFLGICVYPIGWDAPIIKSVCGQEADQLKLGTCAIRWPYILASLATVHIFLLAALAFLLAARQAKFILKYSSSYNNKGKN